MTLYQALYNFNIHESSYQLLSLHTTIEGAERVIKEHRDKEYKKWLEYDSQCKKDDPEFFEAYPNIFGQHEGWKVESIEVQE